MDEQSIETAELTQAPVFDSAPLAQHFFFSLQQIRETFGADL
jgi:hypothetical protein